MFDELCVCKPSELLDTWSTNDLSIVVIFLNVRLAKPQAVSETEHPSSTVWVDPFGEGLKRQMLDFPKKMGILSAERN